jgi:hypothetical protein
LLVVADMGGELLMVVAEDFLAVVVVWGGEAILVGTEEVLLEEGIVPVRHAWQHEHQIALYQGGLARAQAQDDHQASDLKQDQVVSVLAHGQGSSEEIGNINCAALMHGIEHIIEHTTIAG